MMELPIIFIDARLCGEINPALVKPGTLHFVRVPDGLNLDDMIVVAPGDAKVEFVATRTEDLEKEAP